MRIYVGFDDTDTVDSERGTGKLARWFEGRLPESCKLWGVVRQQLLMDDVIPFTTHNSSACAVIEAPDPSYVDGLISRAVEHIEHHFIPGSDPGLCIAYNDNPALSRLISFGRACVTRIVTQREALEAASGVHLSGHGGTEDGIIGAAAAVGLTAYGWGGRFIEFGRLRSFPDKVSTSDLEQAGIAVVSVDREAKVPSPGDRIDTRGWLRPRLWGGRPVLPVVPGEDHSWVMVGEKNRNGNKG